MSLRVHARLDFQHPLLVKLFDGKLALAPITLQGNDRVLDSGAGTGVHLSISRAHLNLTLFLLRYLDARIRSSKFAVRHLLWH